MIAQSGLCQTWSEAERRIFWCYGSFNQRTIGPVNAHLKSGPRISISLREIFWVVAGQLSDSLKIFVGQKKKVPDKNNRVLLNSNTSLSKYSKHCKFDGKQPKYTGNMCNFHPLKTKSPKILSVHFLDNNFFFVGHTVRQADKIRRTVQKFASFVRQTGGFRKEWSIWCLAEDKGTS